MDVLRCAGFCAVRFAHSTAQKPATLRPPLNLALGGSQCQKHLLPRKPRPSFVCHRSIGPLCSLAWRPSYPSSVGTSCCLWHSPSLSPFLRPPSFNCTLSSPPRVPRLGGSLGGQLFLSHLPAFLSLTSQRLPGVPQPRFSRLEHRWPFWWFLCSTGL